MNFDDKLKKYAKACINVGINLKKNQPLYITCPINCADFGRLLTKEAFEAGASDVYIDYKDEKFAKLRYDNAPMSAFEDCPDWILKQKLEYLEKGTAFISISASDPEIFKDCDPEKIALNSKTISSETQAFSKRLMNNESQWLVISLPTPEYAKKVFPNDDVELAIKKLWDEIFKAVRIDENNPKDNWDKHIKNLHEKSKFLNDSKFEKLILKNSIGTNLEVYLPEKNIWAGGGDYTADGHFFLPNMPTEEIFGMPHKDKVNGVVKSSKPLNYRGNIIEHFSITFKEGRIVDFSAETGYETLKGLINTDEGSHRIGEIALVPYESPISLSNIIFYNTLFDENASCHLAIGRAYPTNLEGGDKMNQEELAANGANNSLTHVDFMIGTKDMSIIGIKKDGTEALIFKDGNWAF